MKKSLLILSAIIFASPFSTFAAKPATGGNTAPKGPVEIPGGVYAETFVIDQSGTYRLAGDRSLAVGYTGSMIEISVPNVTIDLGGFAMYGFDGSGTGSNGINGVLTLNTVVENVVVRNGTVQGFKGHGIYLKDRSTIESVRVLDNGLNGIFAYSDTTIKDCSAMDNGHNGIQVDSAIIRNTHCNSNDDAGIVMGNGTVENCRTNSNQGNGISGGGYLIVRGCVVIDNNRDNIAWGCGISVGSRAIIEGCNITENTNSQVQIGGSAVVKDSFFSTSYQSQGIVVYANSATPLARVSNNTFVGPMDSFDGPIYNAGGNVLLQGAVF